MAALDGNRRSEDAGEFGGEHLLAGRTDEHAAGARQRRGERDLRAQHANDPQRPDGIAAMRTLDGAFERIDGPVLPFGRDFALGALDLAELVRGVVRLLCRHLLGVIGRCPIFDMAPPIGPLFQGVDDRSATAVSYPAEDMDAARTIGRRSARVTIRYEARNSPAMKTLLLVTGLVALAIGLRADTDGPFGELRWRHVGPLRGGRTVGAAGVPQQPNVFYIGVNNGGVWKTTDFGLTWTPMFDDQPTQSIGVVAVAPSDPNIVYVGSGEGLQRPDLSVGDGIYKSTDAGTTWTHLGLRDARQIGALIVDPGDPNRVFVAALGHPYGPNDERGVFRSTDGGRTWQKVLYKDENTGAIDLAFDPSNARTVYAVLWSARQAPWEYNNAYVG